LKGSFEKNLDFLHAGALKNYSRRRARNDMRSKTKLAGTAGAKTATEL
jgi:hypothetical protein